MVEASQKNNVVVRSSSRRKPATVAAAVAATTTSTATPLPPTSSTTAITSDPSGPPPAKRARRNGDVAPARAAPTRPKSTRSVRALAQPDPGPRHVSGPPLPECALRRSRATTSDSNAAELDQTAPSHQLGGTSVVKVNGRQPTRSNAMSGRDEQRKLRSQAGRLHLKSELSLFFPNYDEIINDEMSEPDFLALDTPILVVDDKPSRRKASTARQPDPMTSPRAAKAPQRVEINGQPGEARSDISPAAAAAGASASLIPHPCRIQQLDFSSIERGASRDLNDPWSDSIYAQAHGRAERREKQLRNIERNKAQHEKDSLERLLEGLRGPDWLRVMGISGITDSEKRHYEPKREHFVREVNALIAKFKAWKEEEKRRREESQRARKARAQAAEGEDGQEEGQTPSGAADHEEVERDAAMDVDGADPSGADDGAARQLRHEATLATADEADEEGGSTKKRPRLKLNVRRPEPPPDEPFRSFFAKPYQRAAAIGNHRRSGRNVMAFGRPIPDVPERAFELPADILTPDAILARARSRRRLNRVSRDR